MPVQNPNHASSTHSSFLPLQDFGYPGSLDPCCYGSNTAISLGDGDWGGQIQAPLPQAGLFEQGNAVSGQSQNTYGYFDPHMFDLQIPEATDLDPVFEQIFGSHSQYTPSQQDIAFTSHMSGSRSASVQTHSSETWDLSPLDPPFAPTMRDDVYPAFNWTDDTD
jgi:hypothetical protein